MKRILLLNPNTYDNPYPVFPLGLAYIDDALQQAGHKTEWFDLNLDTLENLLIRLERGNYDFLAISLRNVDDVRISVKEFFVDRVQHIIQLVRSTCKIAIILGGSGFSIFPETIFAYCRPDYGIAGEGEQAFLKVLAGGDLDNIPGLVFERQGRIHYNTISRLECTPQQAPVRNSRVLDYYLLDGGMANVQTQRGCPLKCCYCTYPLIEGKRYRRRSGESIAQEFLELKKAGTRYVFFVDSVFNTGHQHVVEICEELINAGSPLPWCCFMRPKHVTSELLQLMKKAGLRHVEFGSDSLSDSVLESYGKEFSFAEIRESSLLVKEVGIDFCHYVIFGGPGETKATMQESFENSKQISGALYFPSVGMRIYPDTPLQRISIAETHSSAEPESKSDSEKNSLLRPTFYIAQELTIEWIERKVKYFATQSPNWVDLEHSPEFDTVAKRLRKKGVAGPLWNYLSAMRRLT